MLGTDYRNAIFRKRDEDEDEDDDASISLSPSPPPPSRGMQRSKSSSVEALRRHEKNDGRPSLDRGGSLRGLSRYASNSFRLEKRGKQSQKEKAGGASSSESHHSINNTKSSKGGGLRYFLEKKGSFRKTSNSSKSSKSNAHNDNDLDSVVSGLSMSSSSILGISWGNTSISNDLALSVASFAASLSSFHSENGRNDSHLESEANVRKLMQQIHDRIESRYKKAREYDERIQGCLTLACARYEAGSPNAASLVSMRRVHRLRHGVHKVNQIINDLTNLNKEINGHIEEAQAGATDEASSVLVDIDLDAFRSRARQIEETANKLPDPPLCQDALFQELTDLVPKMKQRRRLRGKGAGARRPTHSIKPPL